MYYIESHFYRSAERSSFVGENRAMFARLYGSSIESPASYNASSTDVPRDFAVSPVSTQVLRLLAPHPAFLPNTESSTPGSYPFASLDPRHVSYLGVNDMKGIFRTGS
jgi:hypothetical protein